MTKLDLSALDLDSTAELVLTGRVALEDVPDAGKRHAIASMYRRERAQEASTAALERLEPDVAIIALLDGLDDVEALVDELGVWAPQEAPAIALEDADVDGDEHVLTVAELTDAVEALERGQRTDAARRLLEAEESSEAPRKTLLEALERYAGLGGPEAAVHDGYLIVSGVTNAELEKLVAAHRRR